MTALSHSLRIDDAINTCRDRAVKILRQTDWAETPGDTPDRDRRDAHWLAVHQDDVMITTDPAVRLAAARGMAATALAWLARIQAEAGEE